MKLLPCLLLLWCSTASAGDITVRWTNPDYGIFPDSCATDSTKALRDPITVDMLLYRFSHPPGDSLPDSLWFRGLPTSGPGARDSITFTVADGTMGAFQAWSIHDGLPSCLYGSSVFAIPLSEPPPPDTTGGKLAATYYAGNIDFELLHRLDPNIDFSWGTAAPDPSVPANDFSVRWDGYLTVPTAGWWQFYLDSQDGSRMWLDGLKLLEWWGYGAWREQAVGIDLAAGRHTLRVEYLSGSGAGTGNSEVHLLWTGPDVAKQPVPAGALSH